MTEVEVDMLTGEYKVIVIISHPTQGYYIKGWEFFDPNIFSLY